MQGSANWNKNSLSLIPLNHIVLNCRYGYVGIIAVADLIKIDVSDMDVNAVERLARCIKYKTKSITSTKIIYLGSIRIALQGAGKLLPSKDLGATVCHVIRMYH